jgi:hypothetical protein
MITAHASRYQPASAWKKPRWEITITIARRPVYCVSCHRVMMPRVIRSVAYLGARAIYKCAHCNTVVQKHG